MEIVNSFKKYLKAIVPYIVYKSTKESERYETKESRLAGDEYVDAMLQMDSFESHSSYSKAVLNQSGIHDELLILQIQVNPMKVPEDKRYTVLKAKRKEIIANYEEKNDYYRMLMGLPNLGDEESLIYPDPRELEPFGYFPYTIDDYESDNFDAMIPIHKFPKDIIMLLEKSGYLEELYESNKNDREKDVEYLKYIGSRKVDALSARRAEHFELLYVPRPDNANRFNRDFLMYYEEARHYFLEVVYNFFYSEQYPYYEEYIGFFILVMTVQRMINSLFEVMVERDFYDIETCRMFLEAYGVPFVNIFTFQQQKTLVKNLNILIMNKCTSQVLYDILDLLGYDNFTLTKYLLVKQHKMYQENDEAEPKPVFIYRSIVDENGDPYYVLDKSKIYDYYFVGVDMNEQDMHLVEQTSVDAHDYQDVTEPDPTWIEDEELISKLEDAEINYVETKYTNIAITIRMQKVMFEHVYLQKMLCDKSNETSKILVEIPLITTKKVSLLEMEVILICLTCKHNGMIPDLLTFPSKILPVLGFNFDADLELIQSEVRNRPDLFDPKIADYIHNIHFVTPSDVNELYRNVRELATVLINCMQTTPSEKVYHACRKLYTALMVTEVHNEVFALPDGSIPETYMDWLEAYNPEVYRYIDTMEVDDCVDKINYIATKMMTMFVDTKYLSYLNLIDTTVIEGILRILRWFKSYTLDIRELEIIYLFDSRYYNMMRMIDRLYIHANLILREPNIGFSDWVGQFKAALMHKETMGKLYDIARASAKFTIEQFDSIIKDTMRMYSNLHVNEFMLTDYMDRLYMAVENMTLKDRMRMSDTRRSLKFIIHDD